MKTAMVTGGFDIFYGGSIVTDDAIAVRPAFWIKKSYFDFVD